MNHIKIIVVLLLGFANSLDLIGQDEKKLLKNYFYVGLAISDPQSFDTLSNNIDQNYNTEKYIVQWARYNFKTPELSAGWMFKRKRFFLNSSLAFWLGQKNITYYRTYSANSLDPKDAMLPYDSVNIYNYYAIHENFIGKVLAYNLDWHLTVGANLGKHLAVSLGYQRDFLLYTATSGSLYKYGSHVILSQFGREYFSDRYVGSDIKKHWSQALSGIDYFSLGFNYSMEWNKRDLFCELQISRPFWDQPEANFTYFRLKVACSIFNFTKSEAPKE